LAEKEERRQRNEEIVEKLERERKSPLVRNGHTTREH